MKKGFSLIEILVVISILIILFSCSISLMEIGKKLSDRVSFQTCSIQILDFINTSRRYCRRNRIDGYIICDTGTNAIKFICNSHLIYKFYLPKGFVLFDLNATNGSIQINSQGVSGSACTIKYEDKNKELHLITMRVGTAYVEIKQ